MLDASFFRDQIAAFLKEDDIDRNAAYAISLPDDTVECELKIKDDIVLAGLPFFLEVFDFLGHRPELKPSLFEKRSFKKDENKVIKFELPFSVALQGERLALNLLQRASSIATYTSKYVELVSENNIAILDTRKTTPGLRSLEKYAVVIGGGRNHRLGQTDMWMIKDNHKSFFGGVKGAVNYFRSMNSFYTPILLEVHNLEEIEEAKKYGIRHLMLDNFSPGDVAKAIEVKGEGMTYEVSGGIRLDTIEEYNMKGIDAISIGALTYDAPHVDLSLKYRKK